MVRFKLDRTVTPFSAPLRAWAVKVGDILSSRQCDQRPGVYLLLLRAIRLAQIEVREMHAPPPGNVTTGQAVTAIPARKRRHKAADDSVSEGRWWLRSLPRLASRGDEMHAGVGPWKQRAVTSRDRNSARLPDSNTWESLLPGCMR